MFRKIIFPIDCSLHSNTILGCIPCLKAAGMEELILLHVIDPTEAAQWANVEEAITNRKKQAEDVMDKILGKMVSSHERMRGRQMTGVGLPCQVILRIAEEEKVSLIVMGSHGRSFMEGAILGSVTNSVIRKTNVPVLIAKIVFVEQNGERKPVCMGMDNIFRRVLFPTDFSDYSMSVRNLIKDMGTGGIEEVVIVHVQDTRKLFPHLKHKMREFNEIDTGRLNQIKNELEMVGYRVKTILREGVPFVEINQVAEEENVTMIMISSQGKSAVKEALMGSVSESIARDHIRPVMIIPKNWKSQG
ncbi:MAG: universal stress protein [Syntrophales bacterium]